MMVVEVDMPGVRWVRGRFDHRGAMKYNGLWTDRGAAFITMGEKKGLIIAYDIIGPYMAGPGLRSLRLAEALSAALPVDILIGPESEPVKDSPVQFVAAPSQGDEKSFLENYKVCLASSTFPLTNPWLLEADIPLAVDCYCPYVLENLFLYHDKSVEDARFQHERHLKAQIEALLRADIVLCASPRQRDLFTGALMALNRLNPAPTSVVDENKLIALVPFGLEERDPPPRGGVRGRVPGYAPDDEVLIWGGGIWEWFDPLSLIGAVNELRYKRPNIRLHFLGAKHPNMHIPFPAKAKEAIALAAKLGIKDKHVFFGDWVAVAERGKYLRDADLGVSFHRVGFETRYSFRTRLMDYIWAELPMVVSAGDDLSGELASEGIAEALPDNSPAVIADAISSWLDRVGDHRGSFTEKFALLKQRYRWSRVAQPLMEFFVKPYSTSGVRGEGFFQAHLGGLNPAGRPGIIARLIDRILRGK